MEKNNKNNPNRTGSSPNSNPNRKSDNGDEKNPL